MTAYKVRSRPQNQPDFNLSQDELAAVVTLLWHVRLGSRTPAGNAVRDLIDRLVAKHGDKALQNLVDATTLRVTVEENGRTIAFDSDVITLEL
jgi:hypothetical protein